MLKKITSALTALAAVSAVTFGIAHSEKVDPSNHVAQANVVSIVIKSGVFEGRNKHITTGGVSIVKTTSGYVAILESNFSLDGAPEPTLGFGSGSFNKKTEFSKLKSINGLQVYEVPANIDPADFDEFYVWCADFNVALGVASLK